MSTPADFGTSNTVDLERLVSPVSVVSRVVDSAPLPDLPELARTIALVGGLAGRLAGKVAGVGAAMGGDAGSARVHALTEAAERYAGLQSWARGGHISARATEIDGPVLDLSRIPRCSATEYAAPGCPLVPFDPDAVIRWCRGTDLVTGSPTWVPSVMAIYGLRERVRAELFWHSISTGYAAHTDPRMALCSAICEVIERDVAEILWAQRLPLPPVASGQITPTCGRLIRWYEAHLVRPVIFDATSDMGVPTAYCLQIAESDRQCNHMVSCATGPTLAAAAEKAALDGVVMRDTRRRDAPVKLFEHFTEVDDGARYVGLAENADAFGFLVDGVERRAPQHRAVLPAEPGERLDALVGTLAAKGMQAIAVDRTTGELASAGLSVVCVIIPDLQPLSLHPLARFRAHARLYTAPGQMGYPAAVEGGLNQWPQPIA